MSLERQGMRFVQRGKRWLWVYPELMRPGDVDCTDMDEEQFTDIVLASCKLNTPKSVDGTE